MKSGLKKYMTFQQLWEILGWFGVLFVLGGYFLLATGVIEGSAWQYHVLMLFGSTFLGVISWRKKTYQPAVLNAFFVLFATIALFRLAFN